MSNTQPASPDLQDLLDALVDGTISIAEQMQLSSALRTTVEARRRYCEYIGLHILLNTEAPTVLALPPSGWEPVPSEFQGNALRTPRESQQPLARPFVVPESAPRVGLLGHTVTALRRPVVWSTAGVGLLFASYFALVSWNMLGGKLPVGADHGTTTVALLHESRNVKWSSDSAHAASRIGDPIKQDDRLSIESGIVELKLKRGATLVVQGPAEWTIDGDNAATLNQGKIVAKVPHGAIGFILETPQAKIVDLGTEFGVSVDERGRTETQVFHGAVELETLVKGTQPARQGTHKRKLVAGEAARVDITSPTRQIEPIGAKPGQFIRHLSTAPKQPDDQPSHYALSVIEKTRPVLYWSFDSAERYLTKDFVQGRAADGFVPSAIFTAGPRPADGFANMAASNHALHVEGAGGVTCNETVKKLGVGTDAYSMQIWFMSAVSFDAQAAHALLGRGNSSGPVTDLRDGAFVGGTWQGGDRFKIGRLNFSGSIADEITAYGTTVLQPETWYHVIFVRDRDTVRIYLNGKPEVSVRAPWCGGSGGYFTWGHLVNLQTGLGLNGRFDEIGLWDRALSAEEASELYRSALHTSNKPPPSDHEVPSRR